MSKSLIRIELVRNIWRLSSTVAIADQRQTLVQLNATHGLDDKSNWSTLGSIDKGLILLQKDLDLAKNNLQSIKPNKLQTSYSIIKNQCIVKCCIKATKK